MKAAGPQFYLLSCLHLRIIQWINSGFSHELLVVATLKKTDSNLVVIKTVAAEYFPLVRRKSEVSFFGL